MKHVSSSILVWVSTGIPLLDIGPRESLPIMANHHEQTLLTSPAFGQVTSIVAAKILLSRSIIVPTGSADNLASTRTSLRTSISPFFQAQGLRFNVIRHAYAMRQTLRCCALVNVFLWRESSLSTSKSGSPTCSPLHHVPSLEVTQRGREIVQLTKIYERERVLFVRSPN